MRIQDLADILIMTFLVYQLYFWFRRTRALQVVFGLGFLALLYLLTKNLGLFMTSWILQELGTVIFVLIIVVFQAEIRQALYRFSMLRNLFSSEEASSQLDINGIASTLFDLATKRTGALIVFERSESLADQLLHGVKLDSLISPQLIRSIFDKSSPLHDGALVIRNARIAEASSHLPLSSSDDLPQYFGTRHRAAAGVTEKSDAVVLVVSEERGEVSFVASGEVKVMTNVNELSSTLELALYPETDVRPRISLRQRVMNNFAPKLAVFLLVALCWALINTRQGGVQSVTAQLKYHNLPEQLILAGDMPAEVDLQIKSISPLFDSAKKLDITADVDLSKLQEGVNTISIDSKTFNLPLGVSVEKSTPASLRLTAEKKVYREFPVVLKKQGSLPKGVRLRSIKITPQRVRVTGTEHSLSRVGSVSTETLNFSTIMRGGETELSIIPPPVPNQLSSTERVKVNLELTK